MQFVVQTYSETEDDGGGKRPPRLVRDATAIIPCVDKLDAAAMADAIDRHGAAGRRAIPGIRIPQPKGWAFISFSELDAILTDWKASR